MGYGEALGLGRAAGGPAPSLLPPAEATAGMPSPSGPSVVSGHRGPGVRPPHVCLPAAPRGPGPGLPAGGEGGVEAGLWGHPAWAQEGKECG